MVVALIFITFFLSDLTGTYIATIGNDPICLVVQQKKDFLFGKIYAKNEKSISFVVNVSQGEATISLSELGYDSDLNLLFDTDNFLLFEGNQKKLKFERISKTTEYPPDTIFKSTSKNHPIVGAWIMVEKRVNGKIVSDEGILRKYIIEYTNEGDVIFDLRLWQKAYQEQGKQLSLTEIPTVKWMVEGDNLLIKADYSGKWIETGTFKFNGDTLIRGSVGKNIVSFFLRTNR